MLSKPAATMARVAGSGTSCCRALASVLCWIVIWYVVPAVSSGVVAVNENTWPAALYSSRPGSASVRLTLLSAFSSDGAKLNTDVLVDRSTILMLHDRRALAFDVAPASSDTKAAV